MTAVAESSRSALDALGMTVRKSLADQIEGVIAQAMRSGSKDVSMKEVQAALRRVYGREVEMSSISGRVNELIAAGRVLRDKQHKRPCTVTGQAIEPLSVPLTQERLCY